MTARSSDLLTARPGAVAADPPDDVVAAHYGDPLREQRAIDTAAAWVDRGSRGVLRITGPDRLAWLHSLTTQHLEALAPSTGAESLVLSPNGHVEHHLVLADDGDATWVDVEPGTAQALVTFLESMRFLLRVDLTDASHDMAVVSVLGPQAARTVADGLQLELPAAPYAVATRDGLVARRMPWPTPDTVDLLVPSAQLHSVIKALEGNGAVAAGLWAFEAKRIAARRPRLFADTDHRTLPHEVGWIDNAVHLDKGCYRGQETVARVHNLGRPPRRLVLLHLDGSVERLPGQGTAVEHDGSTVGFVGSAARHHELGPIALALVRRATPVEALLSADRIPARAEVIVDPNAGRHIRPVLK